MNLYSKKILITGGGSGLGKRLAQSLDAMGHTVFITLRNLNDAAGFSDSNIHSIVMDVCNEESVSLAFLELVEKYNIDKLDVLINNAGVVVPGPLEIFTEREIKEQFDVNVFGVIRVTQKFLPLLRKAEGKIINIGSMSNRLAFPFLGLYAASKASLKQISWAFRLELQSFNVNVFHFELGNFDSSIWQKSINRGNKIKDQRYESELKNTVELMKSRSDKFNSFDTLLTQIKKTIENKNAKFNTIVGNDAYVRRLITTLFSYRLLENILSKKIRRQKK